MSLKVKTSEELERYALRAMIDTLLKLLSKREITEDESRFCGVCRSYLTKMTTQADLLRSDADLKEALFPDVDKLMIEARAYHELGDPNGDDETLKGVMIMALEILPYDVSEIIDKIKKA